MDGERRLLKMLNPNKDIDSGFSLKQVEEQVKCNYIRSITLFSSRTIYGLNCSMI